MSTTTVKPNGDGTRSNWEDEGGGTSNLYAKINSGISAPNDATYLVSTGSASMFFDLENMPGDFGEITAINVVVRAKKEVGGARTATVQIFKADETTALTDAKSTTGLTNGVWNDFTLTPTITGATDKTSWDGARLKLTATDDGVDVSAIQVDITYTAGLIFTGSAATFTLTGQSANLLASRKLTAAGAAFTLTGNAASFTRKLIAATAAFAVAGVAANLERGKKLTAAAGSFTLTGIAATPKATRTMSALVGVFQLTGKPATFIAGLYQLTAATATFTLTGIAATPKYHRVTTAAAGEFTLTGNVAPSNYKIPSDTAAFSVSGGNASMRTGIGMIAASGSFTLTGVAAGMRATRAMSAVAGSFTLTTRPVAFPPRYRVLLALPGSFALSGNAVADTGKIIANTAAFAISGRAVGMSYTPLAGRSSGLFRSRMFQSHSISMKG